MRACAEGNARQRTGLDATPGMTEDQAQPDAPGLKGVPSAIDQQYADVARMFMTGTCQLLAAIDASTVTFPLRRALDELLALVEQLEVAKHPCGCRIEFQTKRHLKLQRAALYSPRSM